MNKSCINISNSFLCRGQMAYLVSFYCLILLYSLSNCLSVIDKCVDSHKLNYNQILIHKNRDHISVNIEDNVRNVICRYEQSPLEMQGRRFFVFASVYIKSFGNTFSFVNLKPLRCLNT
jgi:hypothetical protein